VNLEQALDANNTIKFRWLLIGRSKVGRHRDLIPALRPAADVQNCKRNAPLLIRIESLWGPAIAGMPGPVNMPVGLLTLVLPSEVLQVASLGGVPNVPNELVKVCSHRTRDGQGTDGHWSIPRPDFSDQIYSRDDKPNVLVEDAWNVSVNIEGPETKDNPPQEDAIGSPPFPTSGPLEQRRPPSSAAGQSVSGPHSVAVRQARPGWLPWERVSGLTSKSLASAKRSLRQRCPPLRKRVADAWEDTTLRHLLQPLLHAPILTIISRLG